MHIKVPGTSLQGTLCSLTCTILDVVAEREGGTARCFAEEGTLRTRPCQVHARRSCSSFPPSKCRLSQAPPRFPSPAPLKRDSLQHPSRAAKVLGGSPTRYKSGPPPRPPWRPLTLKRNEKWASASCFQCTTHIASANTVLSYVSFTSGVFTEVRAKTGRESTAKHR